MASSVVELYWWLATHIVILYRCLVVSGGERGILYMFIIIRERGRRNLAYCTIHLQAPGWPGEIGGILYFNIKVQEAGGDNNTLTIHLSD